jgi:hypothetical protein
LWPATRVRPRDVAVRLVRRAGCPARHRTPRAGTR